jgi:magnesium chelatase subunit I
MSDSIETLTDLLARASSRRFLDAPGIEDLGISDQAKFPFLALVGQNEMKLALLLSLINPNIGGVLLLGPRGTGKTTAVRSLVDLMPEVPRSRCHYGCMPEDIELGGMDAVCQDCAKKYGEGESLTISDRVQLIELPLNARLEDVIGGADERSAAFNRLRIKKGLLAKADRQLLYVDEVNLLADDVVDVILDAAAQGNFTVHRGPVTATYRARFVLIGSMNPEEGQLRPQILDRFGLRVVVRGLEGRKERTEAYRRSVHYLNHPQEIANAYAQSTLLVKRELEEARAELDQVEIKDATLKFGSDLIEGMGIESLRAEITLFEAARAYAIADGRKKVTRADIRVTAPLALRLRRSSFIEDYMTSQSDEEKQIEDLIKKFSSRKKRKSSTPKTKS